MGRKTRESFDSVDEAISEIVKGRIVIVTDDASRENEGDLVMAAAKVTAENVNQMLLHGRGLICVRGTSTSSILTSLSAFASSSAFSSFTAGICSP